MASIPLTTELVNGSMATYVFAMGDARAYTRVYFPSVIKPGGVPRPTTLQDVYDLGVALDSLTESKLISTMVSLEYDDSNIPASDSGAEETAFALFRAGNSAFQIRIPNTEGLDKSAVWDAIGSKVYDPVSGAAPQSIVNINFKTDRRARMSV